MSNEALSTVGSNKSGSGWGGPATTSQVLSCFVVVLTAVLGMFWFLMQQYSATQVRMALADDHISNLTVAVARIETKVDKKDEADANLLGQIQAINYALHHVKDKP